MGKPLEVFLGLRKAIQAIVIEHKPDGTAHLGVRVFVPAGIQAGQQAYAMVTVAVDVTSEQRAEIIRALEGKASEQSNPSPETQGESPSVLGNPPSVASDGGTRGTNPKGKKVR